MNKNIMFVSLPLLGHTNQMIAMATELVQRGYQVRFVISESAKNWVSKTGAEFIPWQIKSNEKTNNNNHKTEDFWKDISQEKSTLRGEQMMLKRLISSYRPMYENLIPIFNKYQPDLLIIDRAAIPAMDLAQKMNIPYIIQSRFLGNFVKTNDQYPRFGTSYSITMNVWQRFFNFIRPTLLIPYLAPTAIKLNKIRQECAGNKKLDDPFDKKPIIVGTDFAFEISRPLPPWVKMVGPILPKTPEPIDSSLSQWLEDDPEGKGIIYVAFGTLANIEQWQCQELVAGLEKTGLKVLWSLPKQQQNILTNLPSSFRVEDFVPQQAVLSHPNVRVFVSHCGMNSINEALYSAKPILALPFFGDQHYNAARIVDIGVGLKLNKQKFNRSQVIEKINTLLMSSTYTEVANRISVILKNTGGLNKAADIVEKMLLEEVNSLMR
jgi:UDP:flavonoid glycosyltransferase YjiC (YdhE family)